MLLFEVIRDSNLNYRKVTIVHSRDAILWFGAIVVCVNAYSNKFLQILIQIFRNFLFCLYNYLAVICDKLYNYSIDYRSQCHEFLDIEMLIFMSLIELYV